MEKQLIPKLRFPEFKEDWERKVIKDIATKITDGTHDTPKPLSKGVPFLTAIHVKDGFIDYDNCYYLPLEVHEKIYERCNPEKDDLLMVNIGAGTATSALVKVNYEFSLKNVALIKPNKNIVNPDFLEQVQRKNSLRLKHQISSGGAQPFLSLKEIGKLKLNIPKPEEQQKIASFLTSVDERITLLTKQKEKLEQYKKGIMQQLFSQEIRFKDDNGNDFPEWEEKKLGDVCELFHGYQFRSSDFKQSGLAIIKISNVIGSNLNLSDLTYIDKGRFHEFERFEIKNNDILMSLTGNIGRVIEVKNTPFKLIQNYRVGKFIPLNEKILGKPFLKFLLMSDIVFGRFNQLSNQSAQANFGKQDMDKILIKLPTIEEQQKIASFLSAIDEQIEQVGKQIDTTTSFKKGLLQQLFV